MKIKILSNMPGLTKGDLPIVTTDGKIKIYGHTYNAEKLVERGWAEYVKDDIDIQEIRKSKYIGRSGIVCEEFLEVEIKSFEAYRIVKTLIDQLNGDWKPDWGDEDKGKYTIIYRHDVIRIWVHESYDYQWSVIPTCKDEETALKVIELCGPELKVLFNIK